MTTVRAITRQRRAAIAERTRRATLAQQWERLPIEVQVAHAICFSLYPCQGCACRNSPDKPACERMVGIGRHVVDTVRRHDRKQAEGKGE